MWRSVFIGSFLSGSLNIVFYKFDQMDLDDDVLDLHVGPMDLVDSDPEALGPTGSSKDLGGCQGQDQTTTEQKAVSVTPGVVSSVSVLSSSAVQPEPVCRPSTRADTRAVP